MAATRSSLGLRLFADSTPSAIKYNPDCLSQPFLDVAEKAMKIPKLAVGTIEISFSTALFLFYDARWAINKKLQAWRTSFGLSQREFARLTGFGPDTIRRWEKGKDYRATKILSEYGQYWQK